MSTVSLKIDWATHAQAEYACRRWHYSKKIPKSKIVKIGVWENGIFIGVVLFSTGANNNIGKPYQLEVTEVCELTRIALNGHLTPVSRILSISLQFLKKSNPRLKLVVSYADLDQGHHGGIYQATNWIYTGKSKTQLSIKIHGVIDHRKTVYDRYGTNSFEWIKNNIDADAEKIHDQGKHKYLMVLDKGIREKISLLSLPYPKRIAPKAEDSMRSQTMR